MPSRRRRRLRRRCRRPPRSRRRLRSSRLRRLRCRPRFPRPRPRPRSGGVAHLLPSGQSSCSSWRCAAPAAKLWVNGSALRTATTATPLLRKTRPLLRTLDSLKLQRFPCCHFKKRNPNEEDERTLFLCVCVVRFETPMLFSLPIGRLRHLLVAGGTSRGWGGRHLLARRGRGELAREAGRQGASTRSLTHPPCRRTGHGEPQRRGDVRLTMRAKLSPSQQRPVGT